MPSGTNTSEQTPILRKFPGGILRRCADIAPQYKIACMAFLGFTMMYILRVTLSVAIVAMTTNTTLVIDGSVIQHRDFDWDKKEQGTILSSFFIGYIFTQILGGYYARKWGGDVVFGAGLLVTSIATMLTPLMADSGKAALIAIRVTEGLSEGVVYPSAIDIWNRWAPTTQKSRLVTFTFSGSYFGTVIGMAGSGVVIDAWGWKSIFYLTGGIGIVWAIGWYLFMRKINQDEGNESLLAEELREKKIPLKSLMTSLPVWAIFIAHTVENWGFYTLLTELPTFMHYALHYNVSKAGLLSSLPYIAMAFTVQLGGHLADWLIKRDHSTTWVRKIMTGLGFLLQAIFLVSTGYVGKAASTAGEDQAAGYHFAVNLCVILAVGFGGFAWAGFSVNQLDVAPQFGSMIMGISNTFATLPGIVSPTLTGAIVENNEDGWTTVFWIAGVFYLFGSIFYLTFASGSRQSWAQEEVGEDYSPFKEIKEGPKYDDDSSVSTYKVE